MKRIGCILSLLVLLHAYSGLLVAATAPSVVGNCEWLSPAPMSTHTRKSTVSMELTVKVDGALTSTPGLHGVFIHGENPDLQNNVLAEVPIEGQIVGLSLSDAVPSGLWTLHFHVVDEKGQRHATCSTQFATHPLGDDEEKENEPDPSPYKYQPFDCQIEDIIAMKPELRKGFGVYRHFNHTQCLRKAIALMPDSPHLKTLYAMNRLVLGDWSACLAAAQKAMQDIQSVDQDANGGNDGRASGGSDGTRRVRHFADSSVKECSSQLSRPTPFGGWHKKVSKGPWRGGQPTHISNDESRNSNTINTVQDKYLSVVMVARHDDTHFCQHMPNACLDRLRASLSSWVYALREYRVSSEIVIVEWNPYVHANLTVDMVMPSEGFEQIANFIQDTIQSVPGAPAIRVMTIPHHIHLRYWNPLEFDLLEFIGKNVAGRRARGKFLLFTNPDDVPSNQLMQVFSEQLLKKDIFYGAFRGVLEHHMPLDDKSSGISMNSYAQANNFVDVSKTFLPGQSESSWPTAPCGGDSNGQEPVRSRQYGDYYDSAAGDFFLLSRDAFDDIRGFTELPNNIYMDGTAVHSAAARGYGQQVFKPPCSIFHQDHPRSFNTAGSYVHMTAYQNLARSLLSEGERANIKDDESQPSQETNWARFNGADWGLASELIDEIVLLPNF